MRGYQKPRSGDFPVGPAVGRGGFATGFGGGAAGGGGARCVCAAAPPLPPNAVVEVGATVGAGVGVGVATGAVTVGAAPPDPEPAVVVADATGGVVGDAGGSPVLAPLPLPSDAGSVASGGGDVCDVLIAPFTPASFFLRIAVLMISTRPTTPATTDTLRIAAVIKRRRRAAWADSSMSSAGGYSMAAEPSVAELVALGTSESPDKPMLLGDETSSPCEGGALEKGVGA